ncbi:uncharacterized protein LOC105692831 [Athalia rosae]|uniref:uncharacterized protein LOC105692831 n=1 Tax=Athalia rosae TaxID=37344 RepID=UPI002033B5AB|nr:uncharacterized protein LOC105692831 [Athalia rosae]
MNSVDHISNDFEPRAIPKPAPRFDNPPVPSVPEVSLVFDKPPDTQNSDYNVKKSQSIDKFDSYATWKQAALLSQETKLGYTMEKPRHLVGSSLERCHDQSEANQLHKGVIINESLKHSKSDQSLTKRTLVYNGPSKMAQNGSTLSSTRNITMKGNSGGHGRFENSFENVQGERLYPISDKNRGSLDGNWDKQRSLPYMQYESDNRQCAMPMNTSLKPQQADTNLEYLNCDASIRKPNIQRMSIHHSASSPNRFQPDYSNSAGQNLNFHPRSHSNQNFHPNMYPRFHQFPPFCDSEYGYPYSPPYLPNGREHEDTVKNLLQLINNQSEQIKSLQSQVERLLKIQEDSLKDREKCSCRRNVGLVNENYEHNTQFSLQTKNKDPVHSSGNGVKLSRDDVMVSQRHSGTVEKNMIGSADIREMNKNLTCDYNNQSYDGRINPGVRDDHLKNKILEQKVSIGVMTSFEFTVQNNPFAPEMEDHGPYNEQNPTDIDNSGSCNGRGIVSAHEDVPRTCQNVFSRVSNLPLENIIEDSESHLSMSQQPSSNFHSSPTIDEFKSSELGNRKMLRNASVEKSPESEPKNFNNEKSFDTDLDDTSHFPNQKRQFLEMQQHHEKCQRSQGFNHHENISTVLNPQTDDVPNHMFSGKTPASVNHYRQHLEDRNFNRLIQNKNIYPSVEQDSVNVLKQYNLQTPNVPFYQKESNSPYNLEDHQNSNIGTIVQNGPGTRFNATNSLTRIQEPRFQQSPMAYLEGRNGRLSQVGSKRENYVEDSILLHSGELEINEQPPPSPEPSIHVEMQEYSSDEDSDKHGGEMEKQTPKVGWTFYNNVLGQVNQILQNSPITRNHTENTADKEKVDDSRNNAAADTVKIATMEQLKKLGISFVENHNPRDSNDISNKKVTFDSSYYPRLEYRGNITQATSTLSETDTSMHMNALALKYLSDEQLGELAMQKHNAETLKHLMVSNVQGTNMSFATMRYLERYQLLPTNNNPQVDDDRRILERPKLEELKNSHRAPSSSQMPRMSCPSKILDISTLKQQPKLL